MKRKKLNYRFYNPNSDEVTAEHVLRILIEANAKKVEKAIQAAMEDNYNANTQRENI